MTVVLIFSDLSDFASMRLVRIGEGGGIFSGVKSAILQGSIVLREKSFSRNTSPGCGNSSSMEIESEEIFNNGNQP